MRERSLLTLLFVFLYVYFLPAGTNSFAQDIPSCHADFTMTASSANPLEIHFTDQSTGNIYSWSWNFSDGGTSTWQNPVHIFSQAGIYRVCLTIYSSDSGYCTDTHCDTLYAGPDTTKFFNLGGHLFAGNLPINNPVSTGDTGIAYLYHVKSGLPEPSDTVRFTELGYYTFPQIAEGDYYVKSGLTEGSARYSHYKPTYYPNASDFSSAEIIHLYKEDIYDADIHLITGSYGTGDLNYLSHVVKAYPNPTEGKVHLVCCHPEEAIIRIIVSDMQGRRLRIVKVDNAVNLDIDLTDLSDGIYFIETELSNEGIPVRFKIVKK
ncbi:MAG: PKD domain-containing protein [Bacteroidota bacterium]|nr:PKD domain-containing protein [Bacteroidota bacterium]